MTAKAPTTAAAGSALDYGRRASVSGGREKRSRTTLGSAGRPSPRSNPGAARTFGPSTLSALSGALGVTIDYLVNGNLVPTPMSSISRTSTATTTASRRRWAPSSPPASSARRGLAVTTAANVELLREHLGEDAPRVEFVESADWLTTPAAALESYSSFSDRKLRAGAPWVRVVAEPIWSTRSEPEVRLWTRFESLLNVLFGSSPVTFACLPTTSAPLASEIVRRGAPDPSGHRRPHRHLEMRPLQRPGTPRPRFLGLTR